MAEVGLKLIDLSNPNFDSFKILDQILIYCIYLEGEDPTATIEYSPKDGEHVTSKITIKRYEWDDDDTEGRQIKSTIIDDRKKDVVSKFYFGGESDSNQTKYEILLNNLKICTKSNHDKVGRALIVLLRIIIGNRNIDYIVDHLAMMNESERYLPDRIIGGKRIPADNFFVWEIVDFRNRRFHVNLDDL